MSGQFVVSQDPRKPRKGVVAMIDALGFKGIWKRHELESILERLERIREAAQCEQAHLKANFPRLSGALKYELEVRFLSDTIVIAARSHPLVWGSGRAVLIDNLTDEDRHRMAFQGEAQRLANEFIALKAVTGILAFVQGAALAGATGRPDLPLLNYRGAITFGEYLVYDNFLVGQAVDDCASLFEQPEGAFMVFHQTAADFWDQCQHARETIEGVIVRTGQITQQDIRSYMTLCEVVSYPVPLKGDRQGCFPALKGRPGVGSKSHYCINPISRFPRHEWEPMSNVILSQMEPSGNESLRRKHDNTAAFLAHIQETAPTCFPPPPPTYDAASRILGGNPK